MDREELEVDVLCVGAGPASLSCALHLSRLIDDHNKRLQPDMGPLNPTILVVEKGLEIGAHSISGAVVDPRVFSELLPFELNLHPPYDSLVAEDSVHYLVETASYKLPLTPPPLRNHGNYVASLGAIVRWLAQLCEDQGVEVYPGFPAAKLLVEGGRVVGARMADSGVDHEGNPKSNFEPGIDVKAKVTVLGEGPKGTLTGQAIQEFGLSQGCEPQIYAIGVKELWKSPRDLRAGQVLHTLGYPLSSKEFGGGFVYTRSDNLVDIGFAVGLDYSDPRIDAHELLQDFKRHKLIRPFIEGGELLSYGAKAIPEGGGYAQPKLYADGLLIVGDSGGFLNSQRLKGIHLAVKSGMLAAETAFFALAENDFSTETLSHFEDRYEESWAKEELWKVRNFRQAYQSGFWKGLAHTAVQFITGGRGIRDPFPIRAGHTLMRKGPQRKKVRADFEGKLTFDKLSSVYYSDTTHEEDQPTHLKLLDPEICVTRCSQEYGNPCQHFCPASVYEILPESDGNRLQINFSNCIHCKTCEIMDPYQVIRWIPPEGGGGPNWRQM